MILQPSLDGNVVGHKITRMNGIRLRIKMEKTFSNLNSKFKNTFFIMISKHIKHCTCSCTTYMYKQKRFRGLINPNIYK